MQRARVGDHQVAALLLKLSEVRSAAQSRLSLRSAVALSVCTFNSD